ncbi:chitosanase of glycosyl hydrolase group 75 [Rubritalea squalenifaciens DSM 18772]|uniref:Chitosanase of glycosyl hydrolase group 75 n=1 Tax=Rubritalea squalenifaciens DSM 18772 TaxID=1123071 RepID=A0A1M6ME90_9BACT|nr:glycoside hydrolase family 75 protein [Rubritalea squalenifaciens]SHJ81748.1 chitosanase of glycosyl hydrolase group 75 [Rubritalea squalenifaciens DSM 18772]
MSDRSKESLLEENREQKAGAAGFPWIRASVFVLVCFAVIVPFTSVPEKLKDYAKEVYAARRAANTPLPPPKEPVAETTPEEEIPPLPKPVVVEPEEPEEQIVPPQDHTVESGGDIRKMYKGFKLKTHVNVDKGDLASQERGDEESYTAEYTLNINLPQPSKTMSELSKVNPKLDAILPGLASMVEDAEVSGFYYNLYQNKVDRLKRDALKLNVLTTKHNFYDCETILNLSHPESKRKVLLMQADMDVVSDGSDGDRLSTMPDEIVNSTHYQPFTSYGWPKQTRTENPMVAGWKKRIENAKKEIADPATKEARKQWLKDRIEMLKRGIADMKARSFLIAEYDPFIVMPVNVITNRDDKHAAKVGDYAVVIHDGKVYPAIVGDGGPTFKVGEASLRLAKEINANSSPYRRPVSNLTVTYIVFSGSRDADKSAPDYKKWHQECSSLLEEIGGLGEGYELHQWEDLLAKTPEAADEVEEDAAAEAEESGEDAEQEKAPQE